jgi:hypothetical protein
VARIEHKKHVPWFFDEYSLQSTTRLHVAIIIQWAFNDWQILENGPWVVVVYSLQSNPQEVCDRAGVTSEVLLYFVPP